MTSGQFFVAYLTLVAQWLAPVTEAFVHLEAPAAAPVWVLLEQGPSAKALALYSQALAHPAPEPFAVGFRQGLAKVEALWMADLS